MPLPQAAPWRCVFCGLPVAAAERCPLLPSSHWACCGCEAPQAVTGSGHQSGATDQPGPQQGDAA
jgi:hypothetical protein